MNRHPLRVAVLEAERQLAAAGVASPRVDAELLAAHVVGVPRGRLLMVPLVDEPVVEQYRALVARRVARAAPFADLVEEELWPPPDLDDDDAPRNKRRVAPEDEEYEFIDA